MNLLVGGIAGLLCLAVSSVEAGNFAIDKFVIDIPEKFEGPVSAKPDAHTKTHAFTVPRAETSSAAVLQITSVNRAIALSQHADSELLEISERNLLQMLQGIERRRTEYRRSEPQAIRLAGVPAAEVAWAGKVNGLETNGKMFCVVSESGLIFFHVMGGGGSPNSDMAAAISAVKKLRKPWAG